MKYFFIFICLLSGYIAQAQTSLTEESQLMSHRQKMQELDKGEIEVIYEHMVTDPVKDEFDAGNHLILQAGNQYSKFYLYCKYQADSVKNTRDQEKLTFLESYNINKEYDESRRYAYPAYTLFDKAANLFEEKYTLQGSSYYYQDTDVEMNWELDEEMDSVCGYKCATASTDFRGRRWKAWYTEEIPMMDGPFKFNGLPGLILKVESADGEHRMQAVTIRKCRMPIVMPAKSSGFKSTRLQVWKMTNDYRLNPEKYWNGNPLLPEDSQIRIGRLFHNPIEKE